MKTELYMNPNGKDDVMTLSGKTILLKEVQTSNIVKIPFLTEKIARDNFYFWLENQAVRLPKTFVIKSAKLTDKLVKALESYGLTLPEAKNMKQTIMYHKTDSNTYSCLTLSSFINNSIPEIDMKFFKALEKAKKNHDISAYHRGIIPTYRRNGVVVHG